MDRLLTFREERRLRVFDSRMLRRIFWPKRDEVTREWRKRHNEERNDLYSLRPIHTACRVHAAPMPFPCRAAKGLECVFPI